MVVEGDELIIITNESQRSSILLLMPFLSLLMLLIF